MEMIDTAGKFEYSFPVRKNNNEEKNRSILVVAPHPDDEVIGMGGTLAELVKENTVTIAIVTDGRRSPSSNYFENEMADLGYFESRDVAEKLNCLWAYLGFENINEKNKDFVMESLEGTVLSCEPDEIYTPHFFDSHRTHNNVTELTIRASKRLEKEPDFWGYEVWAPIQSRRKSDNIKVIEIDPIIKAELIGLYKSRTEDTDFEAILGLNQYRSAFRQANQLGKSNKKPKYCEMFIKLNPDYIENPVWKARKLF